MDVTVQGGSLVVNWVPEPREEESENRKIDGGLCTDNGTLKGGVMRHGLLRKESPCGAEVASQITPSYKSATFAIQV